MSTRRSAKSLRCPAFAIPLTGGLGAAVAPTALGTLLVLLAVNLLACSSTPKPDRLSPQTMSSTPPPEAEALPGPDPREMASRVPTEPAAESASGPEPSLRDSALMVVIEDETTARAHKPSLVEAAAAERKRRQSSTGKSIAVVTDKNLADFTEGQLTEMGGQQTQVRRPAAPVGVSETTEVSSEADYATDAAASETAVDPEAYWRSRVLRARTNWASAVEETAHLEEKIAELRQRFYAEEDPYYRDSQIKPSWDRALDRLEEARAAIDQYRTEVRTVLEAGRRASALPGWLREGIDLEPDVLQNRPGSDPRLPTEYIPGEPKMAADPDGKQR